MDDSNSKKGGRNTRGVGVPAKGDSAPGNTPFDDDGATISDAPVKRSPTPPPPPKPTPRVTTPPSDVTIPDAPVRPTTPATPAKPLTRVTTPNPPTPKPPAKPTTRVAPLQDDGTISDAAVTPPAAGKPPTRMADANPDATLSDSMPVTPASIGARGLSSIYMKEAILQPGDVIGGRYEIELLLGEGGMGAVYKAHDREVDRTVALKLIRPELASNPAILARFKQELLTAHQVTHKNVIRIYDIAEADGVKFITMEYVEGSDLRHILTASGKLPPEPAIEIIRQVCLALDAAHSAGIIHRDLKPQNIMQDSNSGRILVMDFGLARTMGGDGMTQTGALLGTIEYMSPEQSMGKTLDQRSDIFALGLIFYELLTGKTPYKADTAMASLLRRNQERAIPAAELDESIPKGLSDIVSKCLERELERRYQNVQEILTDLDAFQGARPTLASITLPVPVQAPPQFAAFWKWGLIGVMVLLLGGGGWMFKASIFRGSSGSSSPAPAKGPELSLAILPFHNATTDTSIDWIGQSMADMLSTGVGQSAHMRMVSPDRLHQIFADLRIQPNADLDPQTLKRIAEFSNADTVVSGHYAKFGDQIRIDATLQDLKHDRQTPLKIEAPNEQAIPATVDKLAEMIRSNLSLSSDVIKELKSSSFQPTSKSVAALRDYNQGLVAQRDGRSQDAQKLLESATKEDPSFAIAFSRLAQAYSSLGYDDQAEQAARRAVDLSQDLPQAEKYLVAAIHSQIARNYPEAIKAYENLAKAVPGNGDVQAALASLYEQAGNLEKATQYYQEILKSSPNDLPAMVAIGRVAIHSGKPETALEPLNRALSLAVQLDNQEQKANALQLIGFAYFNMNKREEALHYYQQELPIWRQLGQKRGLALNLSEMAKVQAALGDNKSAQTNFQQALALRREIGDKPGLGETLIDFGNFMDDHRADHDQALKLYKEALQIERDIGNVDWQAACLNNIGAVYFAKGQLEDARTYYQQAIEIREKLSLTADTPRYVNNLADVLVRMGQYDQAVELYMRALEMWRTLKDQRGAALSTYTLGATFDHQGRYGSGLTSKQSAVDTLQGLKERTPEFAENLGGYGQSLVLTGRGEEAKKYFEDSLVLARELKNDGLVSQTLIWQGDGAFYAGDYKSARSFYDQALQAASHSKEPERVLLAKAALAKLAARDGSPQQAMASLRPLIQQSEELGLHEVSLDCSLSLAEAMLRAHDAAHAKQTIETAMVRADKMGLKPLSARGYFLLGNIAKAAGDPVEAQHQYRSVVQILDTMKQDKGAEKLLNRKDLKTMYDEASGGAQAAKS